LTTYIQFVDEDKKPYFDGDYVCHGSTLSFSPEQDNQLIMAFTEYLSRMSPTTLQDLNVTHTLLSALINNAGGSIKKNKEIILKPLKDQLDLQEATAKVIQHVTEVARSQGEAGNVINKLREFVTWALKQGQDENAIYEAIPKVIEQIKAQPQGAEQPSQEQPQGTPPMGVVQ
jgi:hypothetical protein